MHDIRYLALLGIIVGPDVSQLFLHVFILFFSYLLYQVVNFIILIGFFPVKVLEIVKELKDGIWVIFLLHALFKVVKDYLSHLFLSYISHPLNISD